jgi:hypothetical protein
MMVGVPFGGAVYVGCQQGGDAMMRETHGQVAPLCAVLEGPEAPVLTEICGLIFRIVVRPEAIFHSQTRILWAEGGSDVLCVRFNRSVARDTEGKRHTPRESTWHNLAEQR